MEQSQMDPFRDKVDELSYSTARAPFDVTKAVLENLPLDASDVSTDRLHGRGRVMWPIRQTGARAAREAHGETMTPVDPAVSARLRLMRHTVGRSQAPATRARVDAIRPSRDRPGGSGRPAPPRHRRRRWRGCAVRPCAGCPHPGGNPLGRASSSRTAGSRR
jgi:hypothetical protein